MSRRFALSFGRAAVALVAAVAFAPIAAAQVAADAFPNQVTQLAQRGEFDTLLTTLRGQQDRWQGAEVHKLIADLETFQQHEESRRLQREQAYAEALQKVSDELTAGNVEDALVAAIDAHSLALDKAAVLSSATVQRAVAAAETSANQAESTGDWVEAGSLYRLLDLLFENQNRYKEQADTATGHVRVLQLYAPARLQELYQRRAERRAKLKGEPEPEAMTFEMEDWTQRLADVDAAMLRQTLRYAAQRHVEKNENRGGGFLPLMQGAIDNLLLLVSNDAIGDAFPSIRNADDRQRFTDFLTREKVRLDAPGERLSFLEAATLIDKVTDMNRRTLQLPERVLVYEMTEGATSQLDEFSSVIWPADVPAFERTTRGEFKGVGIQISRRNGELVVVSPLEETPAYHAGIKANDIIAEVDGVSTANWTLNKAVDRITGEAGTKVNLTIKRKGEERPLEFNITRAPIPIESVRGWQHRMEGGWDYWIDPDDRIGYVRLSAFMPQTAEDMDAAVAAMQADGPINGLIIDLRFNPGGLLTSAVDVVDRFVSSGPVVFTVNGNGERDKEARANRLNTYRPFKVAVLVNQGSASASEIVSGALQDYARATVIGTRSFGKGSVQDLFGLSGNRAFFKLTTQYYQLPNGRIIHRTEDAKDWGVHPDLEVEMTDQQVRDALELRQQADVIVANGERVADREGNMIDQPMAAEILERGLDPQIETAILVLKAQRVAQDLALAQAAKKAEALATQ